MVRTLLIIGLIFGGVGLFLISPLSLFFTQSFDEELLCPLGNYECSDFMLGLNLLDVAMIILAIGAFVARSLAKNKKIQTSFIIGLVSLISVSPILVLRYFNLSTSNYLYYLPLLDSLLWVGLILTFIAIISFTINTLNYLRSPQIV